MNFEEGRERRRDGRSFNFMYEDEKEGVVWLKMRETRVVTNADFAIAALPQAQSGSTSKVPQCFGSRVAVQGSAMN